MGFEIISLLEGYFLMTVLTLIPFPTSSQWHNSNANCSVPGSILNDCYSTTCPAATAAPAGHSPATSSWTASTSTNQAGNCWSPTSSAAGHSGWRSTDSSSNAASGYAVSSCSLYSANNDANCPDTSFSGL